MSWSDGGTRVIAATTTSLSWQLVATAAATGSTSRAAILAVGPARSTLDISTATRIGADRDDAAGRSLRGRFATVVEIRSGVGDPPGIDDVAAVARGLAHTHDLVLIGGGSGLFDPLGPAGWALADLCWRLGAPAIVVTDAAGMHDATAAVAALTRRAIPASVVLLGAEAPPAAPEATHRGMTAPGMTAPGMTAPETAAPRAAAPEKMRGNPAAPPPAAPDITTTREHRPARTRIRVGVAVAAAVTSMTVVACGLALRATNPPGPPPADSTAGQSVSVGGHALGVTIPERLEQSPADGSPRSVAAGPSGLIRPANAACPLNAPGVEPTRPSPATVVRVDAAWARIEGWLARYAPKDYRTLRPPATSARIAALQRRMSVPFPADLVASLLHHDGSQPGGFALPAAFHPFSVDEIFSDWTSVCVVLANNSTAPDWYDPAFVPFAGASDGGCLVVDQRRAGHGRVGEFYADEGTVFEGWPDSVASMLEQVADALETRTDFAHRYRPIIANGRLDWKLH